MRNPIRYAVSFLTTVGPYWVDVAGEPVAKNPFKRLRFACRMARLWARSEYRPMDQDEKYALTLAGFWFTIALGLFLVYVLR